jgi:hypothetical protein
MYWNPVDNKSLTGNLLVECIRGGCANVDGPQHGDIARIHVDRGQCVPD